MTSGELMHPLKGFFTLYLQFNYVGYDECLCVLIILKKRIN